MRGLSTEEVSAVERAAAEPMLAQVQAWKVGDSISIAAAPPAFGRPIHILSPDISELPAMIVPFKEKLYQDVLEAFGDWL